MRVLNIIIGLFYVMFGVYLWNHPVDTLVTYSLILGIVHLSGAIAGLIYGLVKKSVQISWENIILSFVIGLGILCLPLFSLTMILWLFVFSFLAVAIYYLSNVLKNKGQKWYIVQLIIAILGVVYGFVMLFNPIAGFATMAKILAFGVITNGLLYIFVSNE